LLNGTEPPATAGDLRSAVASMPTPDAVDPEALWALGERLGYTVEIRPSTLARPARYDVLFRRADGPQRDYRFPGAADQPPGGCANHPLQQRIRQRFTPVWRGHLKEKVPDYMVPSQFVPIDEMPLNADGTRDLAALPNAPLPVPDADEPQAAQHTPAPSDPSLEESVREVWTEVLGIPDIDAGTVFFDAGGDSLTAMRVVSRLHARHGSMSMRTFMSAPTIAGLANALAATAQTPSTTTQAPSTTTQASAVVPAGPETAVRHPLSRAQRQMWDVANRLPGVGFFIVASALSVDGPLDLAALERTFAELATRHEALRTWFEDTGDGPVQVVEPHVNVTIDFEDHTADENPVRSCEKLMV
ncbi:MAG: phosphopantetheine-binding protein, partial [Micromonosporaceae bacterium]